MKHSTLYWSVAAVVGLGVWIGVAHRMNEAGTYDHEPNFLHLKGSPYGRTIAYAMRGPADLYWHRGQIEDHSEIEERTEVLGLEIGEDEDVLNSVILDMKREHEEEEAAELLPEPEDEAPLEFENMRERLLHSIKQMRMTYYTRTNPHGDTPQLKAWRFGEAEDLLKLSYEMDPTNLICYGSYYLFVSESIARLKGAENEETLIQMRQEQALKISLGALEACGNYLDEPTAAITAASAANDAVTLLGTSTIAKPGAVETMEDFFRRSLQQYVTARDKMITEGTWTNYSIYRRDEMESAFELLRAIYHASERQP